MKNGIIETLIITCITLFIIGFIYEHQIKDLKHEIENCQKSYIDTIIQLRFNYDNLKSNQSALEYEAEKAWQAYNNLQYICDSIKDSEIQYINVYPMLHKEIKNTSSLIAIPVWVTKKEYDYLNRFN